MLGLRVSGLPSPSSATPHTPSWGSAVPDEFAPKVAPPRAFAIPANAGIHVRARQGAEFERVVLSDSAALIERHLKAGRDVRYTVHYATLNQWKFAVTNMSTPQHFIFNALDLGRAVRAERRVLGKTQADLAREAGCRRQTIGDLETGRNVSIQTLMAVLGSLGKRLVLADARPSIDDMHLLLDPDDEDQAT